MQPMFFASSSRLMAAAILVASCGSVFAQGASGPMGGSMRGSDDMGQAMRSGMESMSQMKMTGDTDKDFAMMMKMHHEQAVKMAKFEVAEGKSPEIKAMAAKMMKDQQREIGQLDAWLKKHP